MIIDKNLQVATAQAFTASAASEDSIDLGNSRNIGPGRPMWLVAACKVSLGGTSTPTVSVAVQTDSASNFGTVQTKMTSQAKAGVVAGDRIVVPFPYENERYVRAYVTLTGTDPTITLDIWLTDQEPTSWESQPDAISAP